MESFSHAAKLPSDPVYDLPSWLEHNYPQYDASPKSPFYNWIMWMRDNLPRDKQRNIIAFHEYMQSGKFRPAILRQSNYVSSHSIYINMLRMKFTNIYGLISYNDFLEISS